MSCKEGFAALPRTLIRLARSAFNPTKTTGKVCIHAAQKKPAWLSTARGGCGAEPGRFVSDSHQAEEAWGTQSDTDDRGASQGGAGNSVKKSDWVT
jgi:hypothetical protein